MNIIIQLISEIENLYKQHKNYVEQEQQLDMIIYNLYHLEEDERNFIKQHLQQFQ